MMEEDALSNAKKYLQLLTERDKMERSLEGLISQNFDLQSENLELRKAPNRPESVSILFLIQGAVEVNETVLQSLQNEIYTQKTKNTSLSTQVIKLTDKLAAKDSELLTIQTELHHLKQTTVNIKDMQAMEVALAKIQDALNVQVQENTAMNGIVKDHEQTIMGLKSEKDRYLDELLKLKSEQVTQYDELNQMQANLEQKEKKLREQEELLAQEMEAMKMVQDGGGRNTLSQSYHPKSKMEKLTEEGFLDVKIIDGGPNLGQFQKQRTQSTANTQRPTFGSQAGFQDRSFSMYDNYEQFDRPVLSVCYPPTEPVRKQKAHDGGAECLSFSFDGKKIATGGGDGMVKLWDTIGQAETKIASVGRGSVSCLAINQSSQLLAAGDPNNQIVVLETTKTLQQKAKLQGHRDHINACSFGSAAHNKLVTASSDRTIRIWDVQRGKQEHSFGVANAPYAIDVSISDTAFAAGHKTGDIRLYSFNEQKETHNLSKVHQGQITSLQFTRDGQKLISASKDHQIIVTDLRTMQTLSTLSSPDLVIPSNSCKFAISPSEKYLAIGGQNNSLFIFDLDKSQLYEELQDEHSTPIIGCDWDPTHISRVATIDSMGMFFIWEQT